jgi:hypothetical protein
MGREPGDKQCGQRARLRRAIVAALLAGLLGVAIAPAAAMALEVPGRDSKLVNGVVVSLVSRRIPSTGVIATDVGLGGAQPSHFEMLGGRVGDLGMWSEEYTDLRLGDPVIAQVSRRGSEPTATAAPIVSGANMSENSASAGSSPDYVAAGYLWDGLCWNDPDLPVPYVINATGMPAGATAAIEAAASTWEDDPDSYMSYRYAGATTATPAGGYDGLNVIGAGALDSSNTIALCQYWYSASTDRMLQFDITLNTATFGFSAEGDPNSYDVQGICTHELGHTLHLLDLYDPGNSDEVMYGYGYLDNPAQRILGAGDLSGVRAIYPFAAVNPPAPPGNFSAVAGTSTVQLSWAPSADATYTMVMRSGTRFATSATDTAEQVEVYSGSDTTCADDGLTPGSQVYFTAFSRNGRQAWSGGTDLPVVLSALPKAVFATKLKLSGSSSVRVKRSYRLSGTISPAGAGGSVKITLQRQVRGTWKSAGSKTVALANGKFSWTFKPRYKGKWLASVAYSGRVTPSAQYRAAVKVTKSFRVK